MCFIPRSFVTCSCARYKIPRVSHARVSHITRFRGSNFDTRVKLAKLRGSRVRTRRALPFLLRTGAAFLSVVGGLLSVREYPSMRRTSATAPPPDRECQCRRGFDGGGDPTKNKVGFGTRSPDVARRAALGRTRFSGKIKSIARDTRGRKSSPPVVLVVVVDVAARSPMTLA